MKHIGSPAERTTEADGPGPPTGQAGSTDERRSTGTRERLFVALRFALIAGVAIGVAGACGRALGWPAITATLGPTAYVFAAHPRSGAARWRKALAAHFVAVAVGLGSLAAFGLWQHSPNLGAPRWPEVGAAVVAIALTLALLEVIDAHHAPAGATALLVASGLAGPERGLYGLLVGLSVVLVLGPLVGRYLPLARGVDRAS